MANNELRAEPAVLSLSATLHPFNLFRLQERFAGVPFTVADSEEPFPQWLRLILSSHCEQQCQYPEEGILWCHNEGIARNRLRAPKIDSILEATRFFMEQFGIRRVTIGGLEPALNRRLFRLITALRQLGIEDISFTTHGLQINGRLKALKEAGLTRLTISIQNFERNNCQRLTGRDGLTDALNLVQEAKGMDFSSIEINRVLLRNYTDDIPAFIDWLQAENLTARLFDLMWQPQHDPYYLKYLISWQEFLPLWEKQTERVIVKRYRTSWRTRILFKLRGGGGIEANLLQPKWQGTAPICQSCHLAEVCAEGYLGCGVRITPDLRLSPCILREDLSVDIRPLIGGEPARDYIRFIGDVLRGSPLESAGQPIPLLTNCETRSRVIRATPVKQG